MVSSKRTEEGGPCDCLFVADFPDCIFLQTNTRQHGNHLFPYDTLGTRRRGNGRAADVD